MSDIIRQYEEEPVPDAEIQTGTIQGHSKALSTWVLHFLMFMQASFHLSDNVVSYLFMFFFLVLGRFCSVSAEIAQCFPSSLEPSCLRTRLIFVNMLCVKCHSVYLFSDCVEGFRGACGSKVCSFQVSSTST